MEGLLSLFESDEGSLSDGGLSNPATGGGNSGIFASLIQLAETGIRSYSDVKASQAQSKAIVSTDSTMIRNVIIVGVGLVVLIAVVSAIRR